MSLVDNISLSMEYRFLLSLFEGQIKVLFWIENIEFRRFIIIIF
jgi:hypothetical protein